jgi:hypothetical protein
MHDELKNHPARCTTLYTSEPVMFTSIIPRQELLMAKCV